MGIFSDIKDKLSGPRAPVPAVPAEPKASGQVGEQAAEQSRTPVKPQASGVATTSLPGVKHVIAVASGKGGVGKSTTAIGLAYALKQAGFSVGILDADIYGPSLPTMVGSPDPVAMNSDRLVPPAARGVKVLSVGLMAQAGKAAIMRGPMAGNLAKQMLVQSDWGNLDYLIMDYPPGTGDIQLTISQTIPLAGAVIVTTPQEVALIDVRKAISMFKTLKVPVLGIIETMSYFPCVCDGKIEKHFLFGQGGGEKLARENGLSLLAALPIDPEAGLAADKGGLPEYVCGDSPFAVSFREAATKLVAKTTNVSAGRGEGLDSFELTWKP